MLREFGVEAAEHIEVEAMAARAGAVIVTSPADPIDSATARLVRVGDRATIRVTERLRHPGARRFSIAHELGHLVLGHEEPLRRLCEGGTAESRLARESAHQLETEANAFAAELLMPEALVRRRCEVSPVSLEPSRAIAHDFRVSLLAAARRFVELTSERCALVFVTRGTVRWVARSTTFRPCIEPGRRVERDSVAWDIERGAVHDEAQEVPASAWLEISDDGGAEIVEHAVPVTEMGAVASLLWIREKHAASLRCYD